MPSSTFRPFKVIVPPPSTIRTTNYNVSNASTQRLARVSEAYKVTRSWWEKEKVLSVGVPKNIAINVGSRFVGETPARSFKIVKVGLTRKRDIPLDFRSEQFRETCCFW